MEKIKQEAKCQPDIVIPSSIPLPGTTVTRTAAGPLIHAMFVPGEVVRVSVVFRAGTSMQSVPFSASATANLLAEGSEGMSSKQISDTLDFYGSYYGVSVDRDWSVVTVCCLAKFFDQTMEVLHKIVVRPAFPEEEVVTYCAKRKQALAIDRSKPSQRARELFTASLFGEEHPYGVGYDEALYDDLRREQIVGFYDEYYTAGTCFAVCSGAVTEHHVGAVGELLDALPRRPFVEPGPSLAAEGVRYAFSEQRGALQSALRSGVVLFARNHPDFIPMQIVATALGGYFSSRLVRNLREVHGYTYGAYAAMVNLQHAGYLAISTEVATEATDDALHQIFSEIDRLRQEKIPTAELRTVKNIMAGEAMRIIDGPFGIADVTIENIQNSMDNSYFDRFLDQVRSFTPGQLLDTAQKYLDPRRFTTVSVGAHRPAMFREND